MTQIAKLGARSLSRLATCHPDIQRVVLRAEAISPMDFTVIEGLRSDERQGELYAQGRTAPGRIVTHLDGVTRRSRHQANAAGLAEAIDLGPWPLFWDRAWAFDVLAGVVLTAAQLEGVRLRWGGDWDRDWNRADQRLDDAPHFELMEA